MIKGTLGATAISSRIYIANDMVSVRAAVGDYSDVLVKIGDMVQEGRVAVQRNPFHLMMLLKSTQHLRLAKFYSLVQVQLASQVVYS